MKEAKKSIKIETILTFRELEISKEREGAYEFNKSQIVFHEVFDDDACNNVDKFLFDIFDKLSTEEITCLHKISAMTNAKNETPFVVKRTYGKYYFDLEVDPLHMALPSGGTQIVDFSQDDIKKIYKIDENVKIKNKYLKSLQQPLEDAKSPTKVTIFNI